VSLVVVVGRAEEEKRSEKIEQADLSSDYRMARTDDRGIRRTAVLATLLLLYSLLDERIAPPPVAWTFSIFSLLLKKDRY
jgi:hypothetical protein